jgi:hypothetical protein
MLANAFPEKSVMEMWQYRLPGRTDLMTEDGEPIRVIYPGRINDDRGADLRDAVISTNHGLVRGDVEIHVKSSNWRGHGHHQDTAYNRVVLHVVYWHDTKTSVCLQNGQEVPTLELCRFLEAQASSYTDLANSSTRWPMPCHSTIRPRDTGVIGRFLDTAGKERYRTKVADFKTQLAQTEANQALYQGIMGALGYTKNKQPLLELARRMPLRRLEAVASGVISDNECLAWQQALLVGMAGLLPSQRSSRYPTVTLDDEWVDKLEMLWSSCHERAAMSEDDWHLFKVRPGNLPVRRIVSMSYLLLRYREKGIFELVRSLHQETAEAGYGRLAKALQVAADGYWARYLDFGLPGQRGIPALIGSGRAADIIVNIILPFTTAWSQENSYHELARKAQEIYQHYPRLAENTLERHMRKQLGINGYLVNSAQRQQGLIHIYRTLCALGRCHECPLGESGE